jgi:Uma2 family endonuclease
VQGAPDLVVEVLSPSTTSRDRVVKRDLYATFGVREFWIADPGTNTIEVLVPAQGGMGSWGLFADGSSLTSPLLGGLQVPVSEVFAQ